MKDSEYILQQRKGKKERVMLVLHGFHNKKMFSFTKPLWSLISRNVNRWQVRTNVSFCFLDNDN